MAKQSNRQTLTRRYELDEMHHGKLVAESDGPVHPGADYRRTYKTRGLDWSDALMPRNLIGDVSLSRVHVEQGWKQRGALVFRAVSVGGRGIAAMRTRYRSEAGDGVPGRDYQQTTVVFLRNIEYWSDIPDGFFGWCAKNLMAEPDLFGQETDTAPLRRMELGARAKRDEDWLYTLPPRRLLRLNQLFKFIGRSGAGVFGSVEADAAECEAEFADDLDTLTRTRDRISIHAGNGLAVSVGLDPSLMPKSIRLTETLRDEGHAGSLSAETSALRRYLFEEPNTIQPAEASKSATGMDFSSRKRDSLGRIIGYEPINMPWRQHSWQH
ncbi:hypothetical protein M2360_004892 [Rhizobium sp. SG_E_25_P2]|uniref:hypothetical protein n=1 Tax=Rhizobium sp. SG_E_25_P2 TaxID=2879942 RepID=UPI0024767767|nr:hypothetical protein [Rhizobium sp. SG_E_25_P2]MDH6269464.1 hypothetical protein [Rhizobium sp. SG_E_25_P2]